MLPVWAFSFFTVLASKTPEVFGCIHPSVLAEPSRDFKTVWGSQEELCFPNNSWGHQYPGTISKVLSGDNNLLVLDSARSSRRKKLWTEGLFCKSFKPNKRNFDESTVRGRWLMFWGIRRLLIPEVCSWHRSQHVYDLKKQTRVPKILHSLAWLQAVRMLYSDFDTSFWCLDIFTSIMFTFFSRFFFIKVDRVDSGLKGCFRKGWVSWPAISQFFWINHLAPVACCGDDFECGPLSHIGSELVLFRKVLAIGTPLPGLAMPEGLLGITGTLICHRVSELEGIISSPTSSDMAASYPILQTWKLRPLGFQSKIEKW